MLNMEEVLAACRNTKEITGFVVIGRDGRLKGHSGLNEPDKVGQLACFLFNAGQQIGNSLDISPLSYFDADFGEFRFLSLNCKDIYFGLFISRSASVKEVVSLIKGVVHCNSGTH